jgi:hypothetical protein
MVSSGTYPEETPLAEGDTPCTTDDTVYVDTDHANEPSETEEQNLKRIAVRTMRSARWGHEKARAWEEEVRPRSGRMPGGGNGEPSIPARGNPPGIGPGIGGGGRPASGGKGVTCGVVLGCSYRPRLGAAPGHRRRSRRWHRFILKVVGGAVGALSRVGSRQHR